MGIVQSCSIALVIYVRNSFWSKRNELVSRKYSWQLRQLSIRIRIIRNNENVRIRIEAMLLFDIHNTHFFRICHSDWSPAALRHTDMTSSCDRTPIRGNRIPTLIRIYHQISLIHGWHNLKLNSKQWNFNAFISIARATKFKFCEIFVLSTLKLSSARRAAEKILIYH